MKLLYNDSDNSVYFIKYPKQYRGYRWMNCNDLVPAKVSARAIAVHVLMMHCSYRFSNCLSSDVMVIVTIDIL